MTEDTLKLEIPFLIPGVTNGDDGCLTRLEQALASRRGMLRVHVEREEDPPRLCIHYSPALLNVDDVRRAAERTGAQIANRYHHATIPLEGMDCSDCAPVIEHSLRRMPGVLDVRASYAASLVNIEFDSQQAKRPQIEQRLRGLGYQVPVNGLRRWSVENHALLLSLAAGLFLVTSLIVEYYTALPAVISLGLTLSAYVAGGWDAFGHAWRALSQRSFDTDLLMLVAALGAAMLGAYTEGALLLFLFSLGHALEEAALDKARKAMHSLGDLAPRTALVRRAEVETEIAVDAIQIGEIAIIHPGMRIPVDGEVETGSSFVDQSPVTGESIPAEKSQGDPVYAGSVNGAGALEVRVTRLAKDSTLRRMMQLVEQAQAGKSPTQQLTTRFMRWYVPAILITATGLILLLPLFGIPFTDAFMRSMILLVAAAPCALALGTPSAVLAGVAQAARNGVLVKGGLPLETLGRVEIMAFDKTGTITRGSPTITDLLPVAGISQDQLLRLAAAVESRSSHPIAQAICQAAEDRHLLIPQVVDAQATVGRGMLAKVEGAQVWVGNLKMFAENGNSIPQPVQSQVEQIEGQGKTAMLVFRAHQLLGVLGVADALRPEAQPVIASLRSIGIEKMVMLTGDNPRVAAQIAQQAGLDEYRSSLLPQDKVSAIHGLAESGKLVGMVGDGANDAPALAQAAVGIAMGGAGSTVALETADVALIADDLSALPFAIGLGRATRRVIMQNLVIALGVILILVLATISGRAQMGAVVFFHEGSTVLVVLNALRLLAYRKADTLKL